MSRIKRMPGIDKHLGNCLRLRRRKLRLSQKTLAGRLGVTAQQLQKYEAGTNRLSAATLYALTHALDVPITEFFSGLRSKGKT